MKRILRGGVIFGLVLASLPLAPGLGQSQALSVYEDWSGARIRGDRWRGGELSSGQEVVRDLQSVTGYGNYLAMSLRREGETDRNTGSRTSSTFLNIANPAGIVQIQAFMGVLDVLVGRCQANTTPSEARLLIGMTSFNDGSSTGPGDRTGDYNARVQAVRRSNSTDAPGILRLEGVVTRCQDAACSTEQQIGALKDLGVSPPTGVAFSMRLIWEASNNRFLAGANANGNVVLPYTVSDALPPGQPSAGIEIRNSTANCTAGPTEADLEAGVGPVQIARPPLSCHRQHAPHTATDNTAANDTAANDTATDNTAANDTAWGQLAVHVPTATAIQPSGCERALHVPGLRPGGRREFLCRAG